VIPLGNGLMIEGRHHPLEGDRGHMNGGHPAPSDLAVMAHSVDP